MTFLEYLIEETNNEEFYEDIEFDDNTIGYDIEYTTQEQYILTDHTFVPLFYFTMTTKQMFRQLDLANNGNELLAVLDSFVDENPVDQRMELMTEMYNKMKSGQPTLLPIEF